MISQIRARVGHYADVFATLGALLRRQSDQGKKAYLIRLMLRAESSGPHLSDGSTDYNAVQRVSNMPATWWAAFKKPRILYHPPSSSPLSAALEQTPTSREAVRRIDCWGVFCSSSRHRKGPLGLEHQGYSEGGFWIAAMRQSIQGSRGFE